MPETSSFEAVVSCLVPSSWTGQPDAWPFVSVIMPVRNEAKTIDRTLTCLCTQNYPSDRLEIIVADGMSTDASREFILIASARDPRIRFVDNPRWIMAAGFNAGLKIARGDVIVMMGGHAELPANYIKNCVALIQRGVADCVGGPMTTVCETRQAEAISLAMSSRIGVGGVAFRVGCREQRYVDTVAFGAYTREIVNRAGPLDEELVRCQDDEFNYRIRKLGGKILISPEISSRYQSRSSLRSLGKQYFQYGQWKVRVLQKHPRQMQWRHFAPAAYLCSLFFSFCATMVHPSVGTRAFGILFVPYAMAILFASLGLALQRRRLGLAPALVLTFPALHFSYGAGFLYGLAKFRNHWRGFWEALFEHKYRHSIASSS